MNTPPAAPTDEGPRMDPGAGTGAGTGAGIGSDGPRVTGDEIRDLGRLRRSRSNRRIAGVAGGLARHLDIDPVIVRVALVVLAFFGGAGIIVYGACWLLVPSDGTDEATVRLDPRSRTVALVIVGALAVLALLGASLGGFDFPWPLVVIGAVLLVVTLVRRRNDDLDHPGPVRRASWPDTAAAYQATGAPGTPGAPTSSTVPPSYTPPSYTPPSYTPPSYVPPPIPRRGGPLLFWYALALIAIGVGVLGMIDLAGGGVADSAYPALALGVSGAALLLGAFWGRAGGIILLGLVSAFATAGATAASEVDAGHIDQAPATAAMVRSGYQLDVGEIELDLTGVSDLAALDGRTITLDVELGRIAVVLPRGLDVTITSEVSAGHRSVLGDDSDGDSGTDTVTSQVDGAPDLILDVTVGLGEIVITREGASS